MNDGSLFLGSLIIILNSKISSPMLLYVPYILVRCNHHVPPETSHGGVLACSLYR